MPKTYTGKCSKCNEEIEIRTDKTAGTGEVIGIHDKDNGEIIKIFNSSINQIKGLTTPGRKV